MVLKSSLLIIIIFSLFLLSSQHISDNYDPNIKAVRIGSQIWTIENLNVDTFRNGDIIHQAKLITDWNKAADEEKPAWCYYKNDKSYGIQYGKLYNFYAVADPRGLAPEGWHIPSDEEWTILTDYLGGANVAGHKMKHTKKWIYKGIGSNESKFAGLPGGARYLEGDFKLVGDYGYWWTSSESNVYSAYNRTLSHSINSMGSGTYFKGVGFSVRCVKD